MYVNRIEDARKSLRQLKGENFNPEKMIQEMIDFQNGQQSNKGMRVLFTERVNRNALIVALGLIVSMQMTGINGILFYTARIFEVCM